MNEVVAFTNARRFVAGRTVRPISGSHHYVVAVTAGAFFCVSVPEPILAYEKTLRTRSANHAWVGTAQDWQRFSMLASNWRKERGIVSSATKMAMCPSYQRIIGMGGRAVPFILREMESEGNDPDHWFWALEMITGADPVPVDAYGDTVRMAQAWFDWAKGRYAW